MSAATAGWVWTAPDPGPGGRGILTDGIRRYAELVFARKRWQVWVRGRLVFESRSRQEAKKKAAIAVLTREAV